MLAVVWCVFGAPKAAMPLHGPVRIGFEVLWFGTGALALAEVGRAVPAVVFGALYVVNTVLSRLWRS